MLTSPLHHTKPLSLARFQSRLETTFPFQAASLQFQAAPPQPPAKGKTYPKARAKKWFLDLLTIPSRCYIRYRHNILKVIVRGDDKIKKLLEEGHHIILTPNHPGHGDTLMTHPLYRKIGRPFNILVADFFFTSHFLSEKLRHRILNARGMFPLNREIPDRRALSAAISTVEVGKYPLVVFPEGISTGKNDQLGEVKDGAAMIGLNAAQTLLETAPGQKVYIVPIAMRHHFNQDITQPLAKQLERLEGQLDIPVDGRIGLSAQTLLVRTQHAARKAVAKYEALITGTPTERPDMMWEGYHQGAMTRIANTIAKALGIALNDEAPILDRHRDLTGRLKLLEQHAKSNTDKLDRKALKTERKRIKALKVKVLPMLNVLYEMLKLSPTYHLEKPTLHRLAEAVYRIDTILNNGKSGVMAALGPRTTVMEAGDPINVTAHLANPTPPAPKPTPKERRKGITALIRQGLENLLANNSPKP